jgi:hypothetical protein
MIIAQRFIAGNGCTTNPKSRRDDRNTCNSAIDFLRGLKGAGVFSTVFKKHYLIYLDNTVNYIFFWDMENSLPKRTESGMVVDRIHQGMIHDRQSNTQY